MKGLVLFTDNSRRCTYPTVAVLVLLAISCYRLDAYISLYKKYIPYLGATPPSAPIPPGPSPPINTNTSISLIGGVAQDSPRFGKRFGDVLRDVASTPYSRGSLVKVVFVGANPRNNLRLGGTYAAVERKDGGTWSRVRDDTDWDLVYQWKRTEGLSGQSEVTISWTVEQGTPAGQYRIKYYGDSKGLFTGKITAFEGTSGTFNIGCAQTTVCLSYFIVRKYLYSIALPKECALMESYY